MKRRTRGVAGICAGAVAILVLASHVTAVAAETTVHVPSGDWELIGDLSVPDSGVSFPVVLMFNKAAGDRTDYEGMARALDDRGIASLRLDLRGHGESTNLGTFEPGELNPHPMIWDAEQDVVAAVECIKRDPRFDPDRIGMVGGSYSGEEMAEAGRLIGYVAAYVELSPGSFSDESIAGIDESGVPWLFVTSRDEPHLQEIRRLVTEQSESVEQIITPGRNHASRLLEDFPDLDERIAVWLESKLR
jgi:dienelactone hydrolase